MNASAETRVEGWVPFDRVAARQLVWSGILILAAASSAEGQGPLTAERALDRRRLGSLEASPDGRLAAITVAEPPHGTAPIRHIYLYRASGQRFEPFTWSAKSEWQPKFSPDGRRLAFLSDRGERTQIWIMPIDGGEAQALSTGTTPVQSFAWAPDGRSIAFVAPVPKPAAEEERAKNKDDARVVDRDLPAPLWSIDLATKSVRKLLASGWRVGDFQWLPSGDRLVLLATDRPTRDQFTDRLLLLSVTDTVPRLLAEPPGPLGGLVVSPDGATVAYLASRADGPSPHDLFVQPLGRGPARNLTASIDRPVERYVWDGSTALFAVIQEGFGRRIERIGTDGSRTPGPTLPGYPHDLIRLADGELLATLERTELAPEVWSIPPSGSPRKVSSFNESWTAAMVTVPETLRYRSFDGTVIESQLLLPSNRGTGQRLPLVVLVHGGPTGAWSDGFDSWGQLLVARGFAVWYPNIRGSTGYGWKFLTLNRGDWGGGDFKDIVVGVDTLIARGIADPERLGIGGWSYGGYMSSWAVTQTRRFKAAVTGAGMSDLAVEYGTETYPAYDEWFYGLPYERPEGFRKSSPITFVTQVRTPTLILQGEEDVTDPISQSQILYRALKRYGVETELVLYPREGHGIQEEKHLLDRLDRVVAWFEKWVR